MTCTKEQSEAVVVRQCGGNVVYLLTSHIPVTVEPVARVDGGLGCIGLLTHDPRHVDGELNGEVTTPLDVVNTLRVRAATAVLVLDLS